MKSLSLRYRILLPIIGLIVVGMLISGILSSTSTSRIIHQKHYVTDYQHDQKPVCPNWCLDS